MIQQDFDFKYRRYKDQIEPINSEPDVGYVVKLVDRNTDIQVDIWGFDKPKEDVRSFLRGLKARTEYNNLNPVSKALANFAYWIQYKYNQFKDS